MEHLRKMGRLVPQSAMEIRQSRLGLGVEKLDRDVAFADWCSTDIITCHKNVTVRDCYFDADTAAALRRVN